MRFLPAFSLLGLLLWPAITAEYDDWDLFARNTKDVCPGQPSFLRTPGLGLGYDLYFESSLPGSSEVRITNDTHVFVPSYEVKNRNVIIPEVKKQHEGLYYWKSPIISIMIKTTELVLKDCSVHKELDYGEVLRIEVPKEASMLEFTPSGSADSWILWSRINADNTRGARGFVTQGTWVAHRICFADAGRYTFLRESGGEVSSTTLTVKEVEKHHNLRDESWDERFAVPVSEAVLSFIDTRKAKHVLFKNGMMTEDALRIFGKELSIEVELDVLHVFMTESADGVGQYEIHDKKGRAFVVQMHGHSYTRTELSIPELTEFIGIGVSIFMLLFCCFYVRRCCNKMNNTASPVSEQPVYIHEPVASSEPAYQPAATRLEGICDSPRLPRNESPPPSYDELMARGPEPCVPYTPIPTAAPPEAPARADGAACAPPMPSAPSLPDYQYQPTGWGGMSDFLTASPLNTDTTDTSVYSSDKLNF